MAIDAVRGGSESVQQLEVMLADARQKQANGDTSQSQVIQALVQRIRAARAAQAERTHQLAESAAAHRSAGAREEVMTERAAGQKAARQTAGFDVERARHGEMPKAHRDEVARGGIAFPGPPPEAEVPGPRQAMQFLPTLMGMTEAEFDAFRASGDFDRLLSSLVYRPTGTHDGPDTAQLRQRAPLLLDQVQERTFTSETSSQTARVPLRQGATPQSRAPLGQSPTSGRAPLTQNPGAQGRSPLAMPQQTRTSGLAMGPGGLPASPSPSRAPGGMPGATPVSYSRPASTPGLANASRVGSASLVYRAGGRADPTLGQLIGGTNGGGGISLPPDLLNVGITSNFDEWGASYFMAFFMRHGMVMGDIESLLRELRNAYDELEQIYHETAISGKERAFRRARLKAATAAAKQAMGLYRQYFVGQVQELAGRDPRAAQQSLGQMRDLNRDLLREARMWPAQGSADEFESAPGPAVLTEAELDAVAAALGPDGQARVDAYRREFGRLQRQWSNNAGDLAAASLYEGEISDRLAQLALRGQSPGDGENLLDFVFNAQMQSDPRLGQIMRTLQEQRPLSETELATLDSMDGGLGRSIRELETQRQEAYATVRRRMSNAGGNEYARSVMRQLRDQHQQNLMSQLAGLQDQHRENGNTLDGGRMAEYQVAADMHRQLAIFDQMMLAHAPREADALSESQLRDAGFGDEMIEEMRSQRASAGDDSPRTPSTDETAALVALRDEVLAHARAALDPSTRTEELDRFERDVMSRAVAGDFENIPPADRHIAEMILQMRRGGMVRERLQSQLGGEVAVTEGQEGRLTSFERDLYIELRASQAANTHRLVSAGAPGAAPLDAEGQAALQTVEDWGQPESDSLLRGPDRAMIDAVGGQIAGSSVSSAREPFMYDLDAESRLKMFERMVADFNENAVAKLEGAIGRISATGRRGVAMGQAEVSAAIAEARQHKSHILAQFVALAGAVYS